MNLKQQQGLLFLFNECDKICARLMCLSLTGVRVTMAVTMTTKEAEQMLHEIGDRDYCCQYVDDALRAPEDVVLAFRGDEVLFCGESLPRLRDLAADIALRYLFNISGVRFFLAEEPVAESETLHYESVRSLRLPQPQWLAFAGMTGYHLAVWYGNNRFCGACATPLEHKTSERALVCPNCGRVYYPNIAIAVIVGILDGDRILLSRYAAGAYRSYALIAGYVEIGETLEDALRREIMEEVGLNVKNIRFYDDQPWGFSRTLLVGFFADLDGPPDIVLDKRELSEAVWVSREEMPVSDPRISMTAKMMEAFRLGEDV